MYLVFLNEIYYKSSDFFEMMNDYLEKRIKSLYKQKVRFI